MGGVEGRREEIRELRRGSDQRRETERGQTGDERRWLDLPPLIAEGEDGDDALTGGLELTEALEERVR